MKFKKSNKQILNEHFKPIHTNAGYNFAYVFGLVLSGSKTNAEIEALPEYEDFVRECISVGFNPGNGETEIGKEIIRRARAKEPRLNSKPASGKHNPNVNYQEVDVTIEINDLPDDSQDNNSTFYYPQTVQQEQIIDVPYEEIRPVVPQPDPEVVATPQQQTSGETVINGINFGIDISQRPSLQMIQKYAMSAGLGTLFYEVPENAHLIRVEYYSLVYGGLNSQFPADIIDFNGYYFPDPVLVISPDYHNILNKPFIRLVPEDMAPYFGWKKEPMSNANFNNYMLGFTPDRLMTQFNYNSNNDVRRLNLDDSEKLKMSLGNILQFTESNPLLAGVRWCFKKFTSPKKFILMPDRVDETGAIFYNNQNQTRQELVLDYSDSRKEKIKVGSVKI